MKRHTILRAAASAGLALAMALGAVAPAAAEVEYGEGQITIEKVQNQVDGVTYDGYQIFKANVKDDTENTANTTGKTETNISWTSDQVKSAVEGAIKVEDPDYAGKTAQDAADFIVDHIKNVNGTNTNNKTRVENASFANALAKALEDAGITSTSVKPGEETTLAEGYWLFVSNTDSLEGVDGAADGAGTSPIFAVVGGETAVSVTEKVSVPTVTKEVKNDATGSDFGKYADAEIGQLLEYRITGTIADNVKTYKTYEYKFTDSLTHLEIPTNEDGTLAAEAALKVEIGDSAGYVTVDPSCYTVSYANDTLTISFSDLKSTQSTDNQWIDLYNRETNTVKQVVVTYQAKLTTDAVMGTTGNDNSVYITYSNNPNTESTGDSTPSETKTYTYWFQLIKKDRTTEKLLAGAKFTIQATGADEGATALYVQADGSLGTELYEFITASDGKVNVKGLDVGTYTVHETTAPDGYDTVDDFTFTISATYENDLLKTMGIGFEGDADSIVVGESDGYIKDNVLTGDGTGNISKGEGLVRLTVGDVKRITLPLTGLDGVTVTWVVGGVVLAATVAFAVRSRRRDGDEA